MSCLLIWEFLDPKNLKIVKSHFFAHYALILKIAKICQSTHCLDTMRGQIFPPPYVSVGKYAGMYRVKWFWIKAYPWKMKSTLTVTLILWLILLLTQINIFKQYAFFRFLTLKMFKQKNKGHNPLYFLILSIFFVYLPTPKIKCP